ncbi:MAG: hypothetical protein IJP62_13700 [Treponema sp.]|nr:hypothetical protein [Treponema sp.]
MMDGAALMNWSFGDTLIRTVRKDQKGTLNERTLSEEEVWFVAKDVATALDYRTADDMTRYLDEDETAKCPVSTSGGVQEMIVMSEAGVYHAAFMSRKENAKEFRRWVTGEVLPQIRRTGSYGLPAIQEDGLAKLQRWIVTQIDSRLPKALPSQDAAKTNASAKLLQKENEMLGRLEELVDKGLLKKEDFLPVVMELARRSRTLEPLAKIRERDTEEIAGILSFANALLAIDASKKAYVYVDDLYKAYGERTENPVTLVTFRHRFETLFSVEYRVLDYEGLPRPAYCGICWKAETAQDEKKAIPAITQESQSTGGKSHE